MKPSEKIRDIQSRLYDAHRVNHPYSPITRKDYEHTAILAYLDSLAGCAGFAVLDDRVRRPTHPQDLLNQPPIDSKCPGCGSWLEVTAVERETGISSLPDYKIRYVCEKGCRIKLESEGKTL